MQLELTLETSNGTTRLVSPGVGWFTQARETGEVLTPGQVAGLLVTLEKAVELVVPADAAGKIVSAKPELVRAPVDVTSVLYELAPISSTGEVAAEASSGAATSTEGLVFSAPQSGRLYRSRAPGEPPLLSEGDEVSEGSAVAVLEIMKTFNQIQYRAQSGLPARARVVEFLAEDGADVRRGDALLRLEAL